MDWRHKANCQEEDPELFFPVGTSGPALLQAELAKAVCRRCSVVDECLQWALETGQDAGVWGGMSEEERRALKGRAGAIVLQQTVAGANSQESAPPQPTSNGTEPTQREAEIIRLNNMAYSTPNRGAM